MDFMRGECFSLYTGCCSWPHGSRKSEISSCFTPSWYEVYKTRLPEATLQLSERPNMR